MNIDYFYGLTPREFDNILTGFRQKEEAHFKAGWEQARFMAQVLISPHLKKGKKFEYKFPWEAVDPKKPRRTREELKAVFDKIEQK